MNTLNFTSELPSQWVDQPILAIGGDASQRTTPSQYALIHTAQGEPWFSAGLYLENDELQLYCKGMAWSGFVVIGYGKKCCLIEPETQNVMIHDMDGYFCDLWAGDDFLLVSGAAHACCFNADGALRWKSQILGLDGVQFHEVRDGVVRGSGEWDPPGGWQPFKLSLQSGALLSLE